MTAQPFVDSVSEPAGAPGDGPLPTAPGAIVDALLRERRTFVTRATETSDPLPLARSLILTTLVAAGLFGVSVGLFRPGWQVLSSAVKLPLLLLLTAAIATPAISGVRMSLGLQTRFRDDVILVLSTMALVSLALAAFAPVVLLAVQWEASYHAVVVLTVAVCGLSGLGGVIFFLSNLRAAGRTPVLALVSLVVFTMVGSQLAWTMRPFVARPRATFEWIRPLEGNLLDAVSDSLNSARGVYRRQQAPLPWEEQ